MKTTRSNSPRNLGLMRLGSLVALVGAVLLSVSSTVSADGPASPSLRFGGLYKVTSSTDPLFPVTKTSEYFLDFGRGIQGDNLSGSVAVSIRRNPNVRVRILAWQYFPAAGEILLGKPFAEGSRNAVSIGSWRMRGIANGVIFERGQFQMVLQRADPDDY